MRRLAMFGAADRGKQYVMRWMHHVVTPFDYEAAALGQRETVAYERHRTWHLGFSHVVKKMHRAATHIAGSMTEVVPFPPMKTPWSYMIIIQLGPNTRDKGPGEGNSRPEISQPEILSTGDAHPERLRSTPNPRICREERQRLPAFIPVPNANHLRILRTLSNETGEQISPSPNQALHKSLAGKPIGSTRAPLTRCCPSCPKFPTNLSRLGPNYFVLSSIPHTPPFSDIIQIVVRPALFVLPVAAAWDD
ncbi:hypothetical protein SODALDRAFT_359006 [Sodiomyces alkalinus F11]|uniref:Uncharacterized protein n=1 Tax=Sodiomyces alkalinus (strain CBS 110278 / VKM F-3762 / F11) TaxID=1314773 RepID=A0A3N2PX79_SODAK|nr:hypothetical protein SODALDRAFT_359006 [Sodiomyces alkalinus F11]ROT39139.1 hypothetical protein SODALDRAFT_359006 [Sodiomyces alkalinus F11]